MEENLLQQNTFDSDLMDIEPTDVDNSFSQEESASNETAQIESFDGQSNPYDPSEDLILGKFKSVEDLSKAYEELQRYQGQCSEELGSLRKELASSKSFEQNMAEFNALKQKTLNNVNRDKAKYDSPEYFQEPTFREMYKEAYYALGENLDTDKFINLLEQYVTARIYTNEKNKQAQSETQKVLDSMTYSKNPKNSFTPPQKSFDEMSEKEIDELIEKYI